MPKKTKKEKAKELWDYYQIKKVYKDDDNNEDMLKLVLVCGNCNHNDLLVNFREKEKIQRTPSREPYTPFPDYPPIKPYVGPWTITLKSQSNNIKTPKLISSGGKTWNFGFEYGTGFKRFFKCPNCGSSFVYPLNPEIIVAEAL